MENRFHHALIKYRDGNVLGLNYDYIHPDLRKYGGLAYDTIRTDGLLLSAPDGRRLWQWSTFDVAQPWDDPQLMSVKHDWGHANSIDQDDEGNLILSYRDFDQVWKVDPRNGRLIWKLGRSGDFDLSPDQIFLRQHDAHFDDAGNLILFDNGGNERPTTRIISFQVDEEKMRVDTNWSFDVDQELHTRRMGSADLIDAGRVLVCSPKKQLFLAVYTVEGVEIWRAWASHDSLRAIYVPAPMIRPAKPF
jgi:arylsulfate sulfotransferase